MRDCWLENPQNRPIFGDIVSELEKFINLEIDEAFYDDTVLPESEPTINQGQTGAPGQYPVAASTEQDPDNAQVEEDESLLGAVGGVDLFPPINDFYKGTPGFMGLKQELVEGHRGIATLEEAMHSRQPIPDNQFLEPQLIDDFRFVTPFIQNPIDQGTFMRLNPQEGQQRTHMHPLKMPRSMDECEARELTRKPAVPPLSSVLVCQEAGCLPAYDHVMAKTLKKRKYPCVIVEDYLKPV